MNKTCARCGWAGPVEHERLKTTPMLAFFHARKSERYAIDVWICDVCASEIRD